jgi:hypothetical protein
MPCLRSWTGEGLQRVEPPGRAATAAACGIGELDSIGGLAARCVGDQITLSDLRRSAPGARDPPNCPNIGHISVTALAAQIQVLCIAALFGLGPGALLRSRWTQLRR